MPQYRKLRQRHSILDLCHNPELAAEVTLQPVARLGVDAAIVFADILLALRGAAAGPEFQGWERGRTSIARFAMPPMSSDCPRSTWTPSSAM